MPAFDYARAASAVAREDVGTPRWWLAVLSSRMEQRRPYIEEREDYFDGDHPLAFATSKFREVFGDMLEELADNWCQVVVESTVERLNVEGFRLDLSEEETDESIWQDWQANGLDAEADMGMLEAAKLGEAAALIDWTEKVGPNGAPRVTIEHPSQVIVAHDPANRRRIVSALKKWQDDDGIVYATVYLPDAAYRFRTKTPSGVDGFGAVWLDRDDSPAIVDNGPLRGFVPVVPVLNNPSLKLPRNIARGHGRSELDVVIPLQRAVNKLFADLIVGSEFASFRQRLLSGAEVPTFPDGHPLAGQPMSEAFTSAINRLLAVEEPDARVQEFSAADLKPLISAIEMTVQHMAAQTKTPPHYLLGQMANLSGDALKAAEAGLVSKAKQRAKFYGQGWEDVVRLMLRARGDVALAESPVIETVWANPEMRTLGEQMDAATKMKTLEVPPEATWEMIGASQSTIRRWGKLRDKALADQAAMIFAGTLPGDQGVPAEPQAAGTTPNGAPAPGGE